jgi:hypothetical protein
MRVGRFDDRRSDFSATRVWRSWSRADTATKTHHASIAALAQRSGMSPDGHSGPYALTMVGRDNNRLTDVAYWILVSLDDAALLPELLSPIFQGVERRSRLPWRRLEEREIRPKLTVDQVSAALPGLVGAGLVELREVRLGAVDAEEEKPVEFPGGLTLMVRPHPYHLGRALTNDEVLAVVGDPRSWEYPSETDLQFEYWAAISDAGEAAYQRSRDQREPPPA